MNDPFKAGPPDESDRGCFELRRILGCEQYQQLSRFLKVDMWETRRGRASGKQVAAVERAAEAGERRCLRGHERMFVSDRVHPARPRRRRASVAVCADSRRCVPSVCQICAFDVIETHGIEWYVAARTIG